MNLARLLMIDLSGPRLTGEERSFLRDRQPGGVCLFGRNVVDRFQVADLIAELRSLAGPELLVAVDQEGGGVVRIGDLPYPPSAMALGAADDPALTREVAAATARGLRSVAINVDFAPVADVNSNPANPVIADRSFGADPEHVARHVVAFVEGLQSERVAATLKHFPGHGDVDIDSHLDLPRLQKSPEMLERSDWPPFRAGIHAGAAAVMTGHILLQSVDTELPATLSEAAITDLLRGRLGFDGVVFSDALEMKAIAHRWGTPRAAVLALGAGVDMAAQVGALGVHEETLAAVEGAVREGRLNPAGVDRSLERLRSLATRYSAAEPDPEAAWPSGSGELLDRASESALVSFGELPTLALGARIVLVCAAASRQSAATQATVRLAHGLARELRERGAVVSEIEYETGLALESSVAALELARGSDLLLFASTARTALGPDEVELASLLARAPASFLHLALWNPFAVSKLPGPALVTFGWRERSLRAAVAALFGETVPGGTPPIPLEPLQRT